MSWLRGTFVRFRSLFRRRQLDREWNAELTGHLELHIADNLRAGMTPEAARRDALLKLGGLEQTKENYRDHRGIAWLEELLRDLRFALRILRKSPGFCVVAVLALALGIGFSSVVFSIFYNGILHPFTYRDPDRLASPIIFDTRDGDRPFRGAFQLDEVVAFRDQNHTLEDVSALTGWDALYARRGATEQIHGCVVTPNAIDFWGVRPLLGRGFLDHDTQPGADPVILLGYVYWQKEFQGNKSVIGSTMIIDNRAHTIVGVMPRRFYLWGADFYKPISWTRPEPAIRDAIANNEPYFFFVTGRAKKGISAETVGADLKAVAETLVPFHKENYPEKFRFGMRPFLEGIIGDLRRTLYLLSASVGLLLFISSSNVASLLLVHTSGRAKEIALRTALGATRARLIRQLLLESFILGAVGCLAGIFVAYWGVEVAKTLGTALQTPGEADLSLNWHIVLFAIGISFLTTLLFGLSPALFAVKKDLRVNLQGASVNESSSQRGGKIRAGLVVGQVALSMLLLVFAGLVVRSFIAVTRFDPGFSTKNVFIARIQFPGHQYDSVESKHAFVEQSLTRLSAVPGIENAAVAFSTPLDGSPSSDDVTIPGKPHDKAWMTAFEGCSEGYFRTVGLRLLRGRLLSPSDVASGRRVAVVNRTLVEKYFPDEDPIGRQIKFNVFDRVPLAPHDAYFEIVGVVSDFSNSGSLSEPILPEAFFPYTLASFGGRSLIVRTSNDPGFFADTIRRVLNEVDSNPILSHSSTLDVYLHEHDYLRPRFRPISFGTCAAIGLTLALIGLFGVMSYSVALQTQEFGVRMALGAHCGDILMLVLRKGLLLVGSGIVLGLLASFFSVRILQSQLWGVSAFDVRAFVLAPLALLAAGLLACYLPARRATRVDPMIALRYE
jgi:putative ABC transport system permease protein